MINYNPYSLEGKTILVTGASSGIGQRTAIECSRMGATLIITGRNAERLQETYNQLEGENHRQILAELTSQEDLDRLVLETGKIDGLVLCSGKGLTIPVQFATREKFDDVFNVNFFSPTELMRSLYKKKQLNKGASVVILASIGGNNIYSGCNSIYGISKAALISLMKFAAKEFSSRKVRVNTICPGMVETPLIHRGTVSEEQLKVDMETYPLKRYGQPEDIAYAAIYLLSNASSWVTGTSLVVDGGRTL